MTTRIVTVDRVTTVTLSVVVRLPDGSPDEAFIDQAEAAIHADGWQRYAHADEASTLQRWMFNDLADSTHSDEEDSD